MSLVVLIWAILLAIDLTLAPADRRRHRVMAWGLVAFITARIVWRMFAGTL